MPGEAVEKEMTCIVCPNGCRLAVRRAGDQITVKGNLCPKGVQFARDELTHPVRSLTTTVRILGAALPVLPVRTDGEIPKEALKAAMAELGRVRVQAPIACGDEVLKDLAGTDVRVVATCTLEREGGNP